MISALGEPLNAEVELLSTTKEELDDLNAQIAPSDVFAEQGLERASILSAVRVEIGKRPDGKPVLRLTSTQPINDPFLDMLLQVEWPSGRLLREYTALLDPPGFSSNKSANNPSQPATLPGTSAKPVQQEVSAADKGKGKTVTASADNGASSSDHVVRKGDTLHAIANQSQVDGVSLEQMLVGIYRANQNAFAGNMNRLKVGQILRIPEQSELQSVSKAEAAKEIRVQTANWNAYRSKLAGMAQTSAPAQEESSQSASGKISAPAEDKSTKPAPGPHDVVKLSKSEAASTAKADADAAKRLTALQEDAIARENALKEANSRVAALEKQLQDMQKLLEIKNQALAEAQKGAKATPEPTPPAPPQAQPAPAPTPVAEAPKTPEAATPGAPKPEAAPAPKPKKIVRPAPPPLPEPSLVDTMLDNPLFLAAGGGGLIALLGGAWVFMRNKRKKGLDSFEQGILTTGGLKPDTVFGNTVGGTVDTGTTSFLTDFGQGANAGMIDTNDVDPIAEAEVYMAYGRDAQAEEILKDAISKDSKRYELHVKLLEIFAQRKDVGAFETLAGELYAAVGAADPLWAKAAEMGRELDPSNPLYGSSNAPEASIAAAAQEPVDFEATMIQQAPVAQPEEVEFAAPKEPPTLDFSLDAPAAEAAPAPQAESNSLDFDLGGLDLPEESAPVATAATAPEESLPDLDASLAAFGASAAEAENISAPEPAVEAQSSGLDFEFDLPEPVADTTAQLDMSDLESDKSATADVDSTASIPDLEMPELEMPALESSTPDTAASAKPEPVSELSLPEFELPAMDGQPDLGAPSASVMEEATVADLDLTALDSLEAAPVATPVADTPTFEFPTEPEAGVEEVTLAQPETDAAPEVVADSSAFDLDLSGFDLPQSSEVEEIQVESPKPAAGEEGNGLDFNFDIDLGDLDTPDPASAPASNATEMPDLDLAGISLDVADDAPAAVSDSANVPTAESPDVDTKLDLVTAYIDMGDNEGARELLEEVLKEGGPGQRERAQKLIASLG
nr:FimV/HubP family polar landmark protein [Novimethylophilus kurashikiensis]